MDHPAGPEVERIERFVSPAGMRNALRVRFSGVSGRWARSDTQSVRGFAVHPPGTEYRAPLFVVNAWVDRSAAGGNGTDIVVLLNREMDADARLSYGLGINPVCDLADGADTPLCSFLPQTVI